MDLLILNENFETIEVIDKYKSLIWTDRFNKCGDFEIYTTASTDTIQTLQKDYYVWQENSEHQMIIGNIKIENDVEVGNYLTITGESLESILKRRIIWEQTSISGKLQDGIYKLLDNAIINPTDANRKISNFIFVESTDESITELTVDAQYTGDNLYDVIVTLCQNASIGFKITLSNENNLEFRLYAGTDRSYNQTTNPYVTFSPNFENIINSNYNESSIEYKNVALVAGEGEGTARKSITVGDTDSSGLNRRELYVDARDLQSTDSSSTKDYYAKLTQRGNEKLTDYKITKTFEGEIESTQLYQYNKDFFMGDICQMENEYGIESRVRITEFIYSDDSDGTKTYPTLEVIEDEEENT
jgi:hypothetical protein